jgi:type IV pilus assembly protein PilW
MLNTMPRLGQRGLSLVELMIGIAVALFILASASVMMAGQLNENRQLLLETRVDQELRAAAQVITRDLRNAGFAQDAAKQVNYLGASRNAFATRLEVGTQTEPTEQVNLAVADDDVSAVRDYGTVLDNEATGYKLQDQVIRVKVGDAWQPLTDPATVRVTRFSLWSTESTVSLNETCSTACTGTDCPRQVIRTLHLDLAAQARHDPRVTRGFTSQVRLRNDAVLGSCPA